MLYLPTKLGDFVQANVVKYMEHMGIMLYIIIFNLVYGGTCNVLPICDPYCQYPPVFRRAIQWVLNHHQVLFKSSFHNFDMNPRSILHGYFNPLVFWYQWDYLLTSKEFNFLQGI